MFKKSFNAIKKLFITPKQTKIHEPVQPRGYQGSGAQGWAGMYRSGTMRLWAVRAWKQRGHRAHQGAAECARRVEKKQEDRCYNKEAELNEARFNSMGFAGCIPKGVISDNH